jgi:thiol:disulfide interchange protein DsbC
VQKSKMVWCAPDRAKAWLDYMVRDVPLQGDASCAAPIDRILAFGRDKRIQGTPTIFFEDGERVPGAMSLADFEKKLATLKPAAKVSSR